MSIRTRLLAALALAACVVHPLETGQSATGTASSGTSSSSSGTTDPDPTTDVPATTGGGCQGFICMPDVPVSKPECSTWAQDCPEGQKCAPYSNDGDNSWESIKCVDIARDPAGLYELCTRGPISTGEDTCDEGLMCWDINPDTGMGICHGMCTGSPDNLGCADPHADCDITSDGVILLCLPMCDPLLQDCDGDDLCIPDPQDPTKFFCNLDASGDEGQAFDPCEYLNACDPGHVCLAPAVATECDPMALGCCSPYCDTTQPNTCPGQGQECVAWYAPGEAPAGYENLGVCSLPMP